MADVKSKILGKFDIDAAAPVANVAALTSPADVGASYTEAEVQAIRNDVAAVRTQLNALLAALRTAGLLDA